jgi:hypothetical protein
MTTLKIPQIKLFIEQYRISWEENTELWLDSKKYNKISIKRQKEVCETHLKTMARLCFVTPVTGLNKHIQYHDYIASDDRMTDEWWIGKNFEGSSYDVIRVLSQHLHGGTEENHDKPQSRQPSVPADSKWSLPKYKTRALPLDQLV